MRTYTRGTGKSIARHASERGPRTSPRPYDPAAHVKQLQFQIECCLRYGNPETVYVKRLAEVLSAFPQINAV
jgi:hypothetical protein